MWDDIVEHIGERDAFPVFLRRGAEPHPGFDGVLPLEEDSLERRDDPGCGDIGEKAQMAGIHAQKRRCIFAQKLGCP